MPDGGHDLRWAAVGDLQGGRSRAREQALVLQQEPGIGACVAVDGLVVVAHAEHVQSGRGQQPQQQQVRGRQVLELVHQQVPAALLPAGPQLGVGQQQPDGLVDLLVEVALVTLGQPGPVGLEDAGEAGHVVALGLHLLGVPQGDAHVGQRLDVRAEDVLAGPPGVRQESLQAPPHLPLAQQRRVGPRIPHYPPTQRVDRADLQVGPLQAAAHLLRGPVVVGHRGDDRRLDAPVVHQVQQPGVQRAGLPGARRSHHAHRPPRVLHGSLLVGSHQGAVAGRPRRARLKPQASQLDRFGVHDRPAQQVRRVQRPARPGVHPRLGSVAQHHVGPPAGLRAEAGGLAGPPPHRLVTAGVIVVAPQEELQPLAQQRELGAQQVHGALDDLRLPQLRQLLSREIQLHEHLPPAGPRTLQLLDNVGQPPVAAGRPVGQQRAVDPHPLPVLCDCQPGSEVRAGGHHQPPSQRFGSRECHRSRRVLAAVAGARRTREFLDSGLRRCDGLGRRWPSGRGPLRCPVWRGPRGCCGGRCSRGAAPRRSPSAPRGACGPRRRRPR